jgi:hypothetical protein
MSRSHGVSVRLSAEMLARRDDIAASWGLNRAATVRRLVGLADVDARPVGVPTMDELVVIASEKARCGSMAAARPCGSPTSAKRTSNGCSTDSDRGRNECARVGCAPGAWREAESGGDRAGRPCVTEERRSQGADAVPVGRAGHGRGSVEAVHCARRGARRGPAVHGVDLFSDVTSPGGQRRVRERGRLAEAS